MGADLDVAELYVSIRNAITQQPYITGDGRTSLNIPYESCEVTDVMYEAKVAEVSTAKITLPSLIAFPELRPLLQKIQEGDRVEVYTFQPDCGDPVIAGFLPQNGIEEQDGKVILNVDDTLVQLRWQHIRRFEYLSGSASQLYDRGRSVWRDLVIEDFSGTNPQGDYTVVPQSGGTPVLTWGGGFVKQTGGGGDYIYPTSYAPATLLPGDTYIFESDCTLNTDYTGGNGQVMVQLGLTKLPIASTAQILGFFEYGPTGTTAFPNFQTSDIQIFPTGGWPVYDPTLGGLQISGTKQTFSQPQTHHFVVYIRFNFDSTVSIFCYLDNIQVAYTTQLWMFDSTPYVPFANMQTSLAGPQYAQLNTWRVSKLVPALIKAGRFNPQTTDALTYQPNNEENLQFLQLVAEKDNAEYRPIYRAWPRMDELEVDAVGTLGKYASRVLNYEQPSALPTEGSPQVSPAPVITDAAAFLTTPPFRFEEGYNLESPPKILPKANAHANDVIRVGASAIDSQVFAEKWSANELGRPQHSPSGAQYPRFEQITNDDRVGIQSLVTTLTGFELTRRTDTTPSLEVAYVEEIPWAFRWRAGDQVMVKTLSLRTNLEQEMRVQKVRYKAASPLRRVTLGKTDFDPTMLRVLSESMKISWLYEQSGTNPGIYVYPNVGNILTGALSAIFSIPLDKYTTGSALVQAWVHWFADANVMNIQPFINGQGVYTTGIAGVSGTDSGLVTVTQYLQAPGTYQLQFKNNDAATRNLTGAFLVLRIKG